jgi:flagellar motor protein MotB
MDQYGNLTMDIAGDVLFASGSTKLNKSAEDTLARIADVLKNDYSANAIRVEGHTDSDPITKTKNLYADNRDLSLQRAYSVTKFLESKGLPPAKIETVGHGEHKPAGSNKAQNRRVVITVVKPA